MTLYVARLVRKNTFFGFETKKRNRKELVETGWSLETKPNADTFKSTCCYTTLRAPKQQ